MKINRNKKKSQKTDSTMINKDDIKVEPENVTNNGDINTEELENKETKVENNAEEIVNQEKCIDDKEELHKKIAELNDKYLRLYSEYDNYRKRTIKERIEMVKSAGEDTIKLILPVLDDFERAKVNMSQSSDVQAIKEGVDLIYNKLRNILIQQGIEEMKTVGELFNPELHEALTHIPAENEEMKGKIIDETQKGYILNGKIIRYPKVVVAN